MIPERLAGLMSEASHHCWTVEELQQALADRGLESDPSSVFRAVNRLEDQGVVRKVTLGDRRTRYEMDGDHHEHLVCDVCAAVEPVPCAVVEGLSRQVRDSCGFVVSGHRLVLTGTCRACDAGSELLGSRDRLGEGG